jgi:hypothetical protein
LGGTSDEERGRTLTLARKTMLNIMSASELSSRQRKRKGERKTRSCSLFEWLVDGTRSLMGRRRSIDVTGQAQLASATALCEGGSWTSSEESAKSIEAVG